MLVTYLEKFVVHTGNLYQTWWYNLCEVIGSRKPGHGWKFLVCKIDEQVRDEEPDIFKKDSMSLNSLFCLALTEF